MTMKRIFAGRGEELPVHKLRRWPMVVCVLLGTFVLLVLFSALIETPATDAAPADAGRAVAGAVMAPAVMPSPETAPQAGATQQACLPFALFAFLSLLLPPLVSESDRNGRILRRRGYVRSFYPVFKQELACG